MKISVIVFPGSNCDHDAIHLYRDVLKQEVNAIWHKDRDLKNPDLVVLPGGFAFGDYLRTGAMAKLSPVMEEVRKFAARGGNILGICNGFQILCEAELLPGVLLQNIGMKFISQFVNIKLETTKTFYTKAMKLGEIIRCPIAHFEGNYFADADTIKRLEDEHRIVFRYCSPSGQVEHANREYNPNGAMNSIAGVCNAAGNIVGLMPHPERAAESIVGYVGSKTGLAPFSTSLCC